MATSGMEDARMLLDQLMGQERDVALDKRTGKCTMFYDDHICKFHVAGLSPCVRTAPAPQPLAQSAPAPRFLAPANRPPEPA